MVARILDKILRPIRRRLKLMVSRGVVRLINDAAKLQNLQVTALADETLDNVERFQQYGFTAHPKSGAECLILNVGGVRSHAVVIAVDDRRYRLQSLQPGEVAIYDDLGQIVKLSRTGIVIDAPQGSSHNGDLTINGNVVFNGDLNITGQLTLAGVVVNGHTHQILGGSSAGATGGM